MRDIQKLGLKPRKKEGDYKFSTCPICDKKHYNKKLNGYCKQKCFYAGTKDLYECLNCKEEFKIRRSNQKFCCKPCATEYNRRKYQEKFGKIKTIELGSGRKVIFHYPHDITRKESSEVIKELTGFMKAHFILKSLHKI